MRLKAKSEREGFPLDRTHPLPAYPWRVKELLADANRQLIELFARKIQARLYDAPHEQKRQTPVVHLQYRNIVV